MKSNIYLNGKIVPLSEAKIPILDRGFLYGDGVFESLRTYNRIPFLLDEHSKRILSGAKFLKIHSNFNLKTIRSAVQKTISANPFKEIYLKIILTRGKAKSHGLDFSNFTGKPNLIVLAEELKESPKEIYSNGWKAILSSIRRVNQPTSKIKSLCYLDNAIAKEEAKQAGANEALMLDEKGFVAEGSVSNLFMVRAGKIFTPPTSSAILSGITRRLIIKLAKELSLKVFEKNIHSKDLLTGDECFATLSGTGIIPIIRIGKKNIGNQQCGPITRKLISSYFELVSAVTGIEKESLIN